MRRLQPFVVVCCVVGGPAWAQTDRGTTALLPVQGDPDLVEPLEKRLTGALGQHGLTVLNAEQTTRLLRAEQTIAASLQSAGKLLRRVDRALLHLKRARAVASARQAIAILEKTGARFHSPRQLSRAHGRLAQALLLRPSDEKGAVEAFGRAMTLDRSFAPDPDRSAPRIRELAKQARSRLTDPAAPTANALSKAARAAQIDRLIWISALRKGQVQLEVVVFAASDAVIRHHQHHRLAEGEIVERAAPVLATALGARITPPTSRPAQPAPGPVAISRPTAPASQPAAVVATPMGKPPPPTPPGKPWYKKWWVWTAVAGAVVVGTAVGLGVGLSQREKTPSSGWDIDFTF